MENIRKSFQGLTNIIRFNWHFYVIALLVVIALSGVSIFLSTNLKIIAYLFISATLLLTTISIFVSYYVYDLSNLYTFDWLTGIEFRKGQKIININAGFDETSSILAEKFPQVSLKAFDFYDPVKHTEISIERARRAYPSFSGTINISTDKIPLEKNSVDFIFLILSAHEIRDNEERILFFNQLTNLLLPSGKIILVEHTRDVYNFLAYNVGFFHFLSKKTWKQNFSAANLVEESNYSITPFISVFILRKNGTPS
jgi:hypothetical protein